MPRLSAGVEEQGGAEEQRLGERVELDDGAAEESSSSSSSSSSEGDIGEQMVKALTKLKKKVTMVKEEPAPLRKGPSLREARGTRYYLRKEVRELAELIAKLEAAVMNAHSFREKASRLLEEAHRARGRLELAIQAQQHQELIVVASEMKACVRRGLTLVHVYGEFSMTWKMVTQLFRSAAYEKFDKAISDLQSLLPQSKLPAAPSAVTVANSLLETSDSNPTPSQQSAALPAALVHASTAPSNATAAAAAASGGVASPASSAQPPLQQAAGGPSNSQSRGLGRLSNPLVNSSRAAPAALTSQATKARGSTGGSTAPPPTGKVLKEGKHDRVLSAAFVPLSVSSNYTCLWWSTSSMLEFWTEAGGSTTGFRIGKDSQVVTAIGIDSNGNVWTGHQKGLVRVRQKMQWDLVLSDKAFSLAIKCIAFDERQGDAWVGDDGGHVKVMRCSYPDSAINEEDEKSGQPRHGSGDTANGGGAGAADGEEVTNTQLDVVATLQPSLLDKIAKGFLRQCLGCGGGQSAASQADRPTEGPIRCIQLRDNKAWISGGMSYSQPWLSVFDSSTYQHIDTWECGTFGCATAMDTLAWQASFTPPRTSVDGLAPHAPSVPSPRTQWRLLTGHDNGQLLLWNPSASRLSPLIMIGAPTSPIRGLKVLQEEQLVCTGHASGDMHIFAQPPLEVMVPPHAQASKADSFGMFKPKHAMLKAHKSAMVGMAGSGSSCATWSMQGSIKLWTLRDFVDSMSRQGLVRSLSRQHSVGSERPGVQASPQGTYGSTALDRVCNGAAADMRGSRQLQHSQSVVGSQSNGKERMLHTQYSNVSQTASTEATGNTPSSSGGVAQRGSGGKVDGPDASSASPVPDFGGGVQLIDSSEIMMQRQIGSGAYGKVYLAEWLGCQVAVKELSGFAGDIKDTKAWKEMQHEVHMLGTYNHPNIMRFMAVCLNPPTIVMQYYSHGSLFDLLSKAQRQNVRAMRELIWPKRLGMLRDVAAGMHYLHTRRPPVVHGDLRSPNLLLDLTIDSERPRYHVKISDFGLARVLGQSQSIAISKTTNPRWTAPEVIRDFVLGPSGDVYSFAIIMWEMLTWKQPYEDMMSAQVIFSTVTADNRPSLEDSDIAGNPGVTLQQFKELMELCWSPNANKRPTFKRIVEILQTMLEIESQAAKDAAALKGNQKGGNSQQGGEGPHPPKSGGARKPPSSKGSASSRGLTHKPGAAPTPAPQPDASSSTTGIAQAAHEAVHTQGQAAGAQQEGEEALRGLPPQQQQQQQQRPFQDSASSVRKSEVSNTSTGLGQGQDGAEDGPVRPASPAYLQQQQQHPAWVGTSPGRPQHPYSQPSGPSYGRPRSFHHQPHNQPPPQPQPQPPFHSPQDHRYWHADSGVPQPRQPRGRHQRGHSMDDSASWAGGGGGPHVHPPGPALQQEAGAEHGVQQQQQAWGGRAAWAVGGAGSGSGRRARGPAEGRGPAGMSHHASLLYPPQQHVTFAASRLSHSARGSPHTSDGLSAEAQVPLAAHGAPRSNSFTTQAHIRRQRSERQHHKQGFERGALNSNLSFNLMASPVQEECTEEEEGSERPLRTNSTGPVLYSATNAGNGGAAPQGLGRQGSGKSRPPPRSKSFGLSGGDSDLGAAWHLPPSSPESTTSSWDGNPRYGNRRRRSRKKKSAGTSQRSSLAAAAEAGRRSLKAPAHALAPVRSKSGDCRMELQGGGGHGAFPHDHASSSQQPHCAGSARQGTHGSPFASPSEQQQQQAWHLQQGQHEHNQQQHQPHRMGHQGMSRRVGGHSKGTEGQPRPYAPLASSSPFAAPPPPPPEEPKFYAPLASSSPFAAPPPPPPEEPKFYAPLASSSPFAAPPPPPPEEPKFYAPLASSSPFASLPPFE